MSIKTEIEEVQKKIAKLKEDLRIEEAVLVRLESICAKKRKSARTTPIGPPRKGSLAAHAKNILGKSDGPMSVAELVTELQQKGVEVGGKTGLDTLLPSAIARRPDLFIRLKRGVYDLKSRHKENGIISEE